MSKENHATLEIAVLSGLMAFGGLSLLGLAIDNFDGHSTVHPDWGVQMVHQWNNSLVPVGAVAGLLGVLGLYGSHRANKED